MVDVGDDRDVAEVLTGGGHALRLDACAGTGRSAAFWASRGRRRGAPVRVQVQRVSRHVEISDTRLHVVERGGDGLPLLVVHGGPGLDHCLFGDYLDPLGDELHLVLVDLRSNGRSDKTPPDTWTLERMAADLSELAEAMGFGATPRSATPTARSWCCSTRSTARRARGDDRLQRPPSARFLGAVDENLAAFEPVELREQVTRSWAREAEARTQEDCAACSTTSSRSTSATRATRASRSSSAAPRAACTRPTCCATSRSRTTARSRSRTASVTSPIRCSCSPAATTARAWSRAARRSPPASRAPQLTVFEASGHLTFAEENEAYLDAVRRFLQSVP